MRAERALVARAAAARAAAIAGLPALLPAAADDASGAELISHADKILQVESELLPLLLFLLLVLLLQY